DPSTKRRLPPGQSLTRRFPVLHEGKPLVFDPSTWRLRVHGLVDKALELGWEEFSRLPKKTTLSDFHCVTSWSRLDNEWMGVPLASLAEMVGVRTDAAFVRFADHQGYDTSIPIEVALEEDVLLATHHDGEPLSPEHGGPLRVVVPRLYAWKACKWVVEIEWMAEDRLGYWEQRGYHNEADPWKEQRFS
ncbi:MAG TPA: sulfite oxidase-like oxidoreductase, partial [Planctomycetes bacterium]|nr:sulfite oxidase-like oxidoreductase [Planctomycetota bacterium]